MKTEAKSKSNFEQTILKKNQPFPFRQEQSV